MVLPFSSVTVVVVTSTFLFLGCDSAEAPDDAEAPEEAPAVAETMGSGFAHFLAGGILAALVVGSAVPAKLGSSHSH